MFQLVELISVKHIVFTDKYEGELKFKAEFFQISESQFQVELYKQEIFSLRPTHESEDFIADEIIWIAVPQLLINDESCNSINDCVQKVFDSLNKHFHIEIHN